MPPKEDPLVRFWRKVNKDGPVPAIRPDLGPCWLWTGRVKANSYGTFFPSRRECWSAHRWAYTALVGPIPEGLDLDHLCECRRCVNPAHLDPVPAVVNQARGLNSFFRRNIPKTHCPKGHPYVMANILWTADGHRRCRACDLERGAGWRARNVERLRASRARHYAQHRERLLEEMRAYRIRVLGQPPSRVARTASGAIGVYASGRRWAASARIDGKVHHIGSYATVEEARDARAAYLAFLGRTASPAP